MRKVEKILLLIWDILLIPSIISGIYILDSNMISLDSIQQIPVIGYLFNGILMIFMFGQIVCLPQIISVILIGICLRSLIMDRHFISLKKELPQFIILALWCIAGAIDAFLILLIQDGVGTPLP